MRVIKDVYGRIAKLPQRSLSLRVPRPTLVVVATGLSLVAISLFLLNTTRASPPCPCNVFTQVQPSTEPVVYSNGVGIEVGFKFQADQTGYVSGIRFYKGAGMGGIHTASLWNLGGQRIAQATFTGETAAGWQQVDFSPVAVTANTIYVASVWMADGNYAASPSYFTTAINNSPLSAPQSNPSGSDQGVYSDLGSSVYPTGSFNATNYWVDVSYVGSTTDLPPVVSAKTPAADTTEVTVTDIDVTATFNSPINPGSVGTGALVVRDSQGANVAGTISYDSTTYSVKFLADSLWKTNETYTVTVVGDSSPDAVVDLQGRSPTQDTVWSFTTASTDLTCPCSIKGLQNPSGSATYLNPAPNGIEVGLKVIPAINGYITAIRFYKPIVTPDTTHSGNVWDASGAQLATVTFDNESDYGWQEATLATPLPVVKDQLYIVSYGMATAYTQASLGQFTAPMVSPGLGLAAYPSGDVRNTASGSGTANYVRSTIAGTYPSLSTGDQADYYVDAVFATGVTDVSPLRVTGTQPTDNSYGVKRQTAPVAIFDQALDASTVNSTSVKVYDEQNNLVSGTVTYDSGKRAVKFTASSSLAYNSTYTVKLGTQIKDTRGQYLGSQYEWSFTTGSQLATDINQGNGGPILVVTNAASPSSNYYGEILRTEGMNYFDQNDISTLTAETIKNYVTIVLAETSLSQSQVDMFSAWVNAGGNLVAMKPDKKLAGLLGLTDADSSTTNQYMRTNTASNAGIGIVDEAIQFKGMADNYTLTGADLVASLYSDSTTATAYPAATSRIVGKGTAMAFTYDLAKSVIALHQGNIAWSGQDRDGDAVIRSNDLFYGQRPGDLQPDWLDVTKMHIPQADEQQRLLANMITDGMKKYMPAPRFWYLPNDHKAALVLAGDDHGLTNDRGTERVLNNWLNQSTTDCSVQDWQCVRASHYVYNNGPLTSARAEQYDSYGFEVANHPSNSSGCGSYATYDSLNSRYSSELAAWRAGYINLPNQDTARFHCYVWSSWDMMPRAGVANGIRYDLNTTAYPESWVGSKSPIVTGSGMNMRLTDASGAMLDVHQGVTNFDNTANSSIAAAFDNANGATGYYGIFGSHYDMNDSYDLTLLSIAQSRNIPIISSAQALEWLDGRNSSNFSNLTSTQVGRESFTITAGEGAHGLQAMVPTNNGGGSLVAITLAGQPVTYQTSIIKGVSYAIYSALPGDYEVTYSDYVGAGAPPVVIAPGTNPSDKANTVVDGADLVALVNSDVAEDNEEPTTTIIPIRDISKLPDAELADDQPVDRPIALWIWIVGSGAALAGAGALFWLVKIRLQERVH